MPNVLKNWTASDVVKFLKQRGFILHRSSGSHFHYTKINEGKHHLLTVAYHGSKSIPAGTLNSIIRQSGISKEDWKK